MEKELGVREKEICIAHFGLRTLDPKSQRASEFGFGG